MLGVCLGHLAMAAAFGGVIGRAEEPMHGKTSPVTHKATPLFDGLENPFDAGRYHALIVAHLPACLSATAYSGAGEIMALEHKSAPLYGVQFHPESVLTPQGRKLISNFLHLATAFHARKGSGARMIWLNSEFLASDTTISANDRGLLLGEAVFETILAKNSVPCSGCAYGATVARLRAVWLCNAL